MARRLFSLLCVAIIIVSSVRCNNGGSTPPEKLPHKALFVLGDSLFDPGNNKYLSNYVREPSYYRPYGETYFRRPVGRASDGRLVPDFIAAYAKLPLFQPYLKPGPRRLTNGANFASYGGGVLYHPTNPTMDLPQQMSYFRQAVNSLKQELGEKEAKRALGSAVYLFSIGGNDYFGLSQSPNITASAQVQYVEMVIGNLTSALKEVYSLGGRKIAFQNVGPLGCAPSNRALNPPNGRCTELLLALARRHNRELSSSLKKLESTLPGFKYSIFDYYNSLLDLINNPSKYGLKQGRAACCGSGPYRGTVYCADGKRKFETCSKPSEYVWFDADHTTESANVKLAELIWSGPPHITGPYTVKQLFEFA